MKTVLTIWIVLLLSVTAAQASRGEMARELLAETNVARSDPARYVGYLKEMRGYFIGKGYRVPGSFNLVMTKEGVAAVDEAIAFLSRQRPISALSWSPGLARAAAELVREQAGSGATGHEGTSGDLKQRIERFGAWQGSIAENIGYGPDTARRMVLELIVDDGVSDRGHRKNIFDPSFGTAGAACGPHPMYRNMCVIDFAVGYKSK